MPPSFPNSSRHRRRDSPSNTRTGATLAKPLKDGEGPEMTGSVFIMLADSKEEVLEFLKKDIYAESAVWDLDRVQVTPVSFTIGV